MPRALLVVCSVAVWAMSHTVPATAADPPTYRPPVNAPVSDPFRPPPTPYGPGNRGLEYATIPGTPVMAMADGRVVFAGAVAGSLHVTVLHPDGVRTTYSFLAEVAVVVGQPVDQGDVVGRTAARLHVGARRGDAYFDPASLFATHPARVRLVAFDEPPGRGPSGERRAVWQLIGGLGALADDAAGTVAGWLRGESQLLRTVTHYATRTTPVDAALTLAQVWSRARAASQRPCHAGAAPPPAPGRRVAVLVAGLGSNSRDSTVDQVRTDLLGYRPPDVVRFSYAGGRVPDPTDGFAPIAATAYEAADTQGDLVGTAARLADLIEAVVDRAAGAPVDLVAHSQGGLVVRLALVELERRHGADWLAALGVVATLGSPHGGADLATAIDAMASTASGSSALAAFASLTDQELDPHGKAVEQLAETSDLVADLTAHPVPRSVRAVSIAARGDQIVPVPRTVAAGMDSIVVPLVGPSAHSDLPGSPEATHELGLALAGLPPSCQSLGQALLDQATGEAMSLAEDLVGAAGLAAATAADVRAA